MPTYDVECLKCGYKDEILRPMSKPNPPCSVCGGDNQTLITTATDAIWYTDCPTASGRAKGARTHRIDGFVDNAGKHHKMKYHHGAAVDNCGHRGYT